MRRRTGAIGIFLLLIAANVSPAAEWFVATNGSDAAAGTNWATAKLTIQAGVDAAGAGDTVWVSNGVYATGGRPANGGTLTNRVVIDKPLSVQSVNGSEETIIQGAGPIGDAAVRCVYVGPNAVLSGFTLTDGNTRNGGMLGDVDNKGGGAWCPDASGILVDCHLSGNGADYGGGAWGGTLNQCLLSNNTCNFYGGGAWEGRLNNCLVVSNGAGQGGGAGTCALNNCTVSANSASRGGGTYLCSLSNSIVRDNRDDNDFGSTFHFSCTTPDPGGTGNVTNDPQFVDAAAGNYRLNAGSPCINAGDNAAVSSAADLDGHPRIVNATVDMGAFEYQAAGGTILMAYPANTNVGDGAESGLALGVTANVAWTAATNVPWLAIMSGESGTTNGTILFEVAANAGAGPRTGAVIVAGGGLSRTCTVVQAAFVPALAVLPASTNAGSGGAIGLALGVTANVAWTAATNAPWVAIMSGESGTTNGTVLFDVAANAGAARTGAVIVAGGGLSRTCTVVQSAFVPALAVSPASTNVGSGGAIGLPLGVTANVAWTAATNAPWLAITSGESGTTNGTILFDVAANAGAARTGAVIVAGGGLSRTCTVVQAAFVPALAVSPASTNVGSGGAIGLALGVTANVAWTAATNAPWLAITSGESGTTNGTILFEVAANAGAARTGAVIVAGGGLSRTCRVVQAKSPALAVNWYVATNGNNAAAGTNWPTAKQTIQAGIDAAEAGDTVWVSNGVYATGGRPANGGTLTNRVVIDKPLAVQSVNGSEETIIQGAGPIGDAAVRCVYVGPNAVLSGFTLTDGNTRNGMLDDVDNKGGGAWCPDASGMLIDCHLSGNGADIGGGAWGGTLNRCRLSNNYGNMYGGGAWEATLNNCLLVSNGGGEGGGAGACTLNDCTVISNDAAQAAGGCAFCTLVRCRVESNGNMYIYGGGLLACTAYNCVVAGNSGDEGGGAAAGSILHNCTLVGNRAHYGGGIAASTLTNCIVYGNTADVSGPNYYGGSFNTSCTTPDPGGTGNVTNDPQFVDAAAGNFRLAAGSPCINVGDNAAAPGAVDLDGSPRIVFGTVDMGAYEFLYQHVAPGGSDGADGISWATAKQTIQAAVDATTNGCIVLVTNGVYATGGRTVGPWALTNRVAIDRPIIVQSVNGPEVTTIQGAGPMGDAAVRCAYVGSNAVLSGFTLSIGMVRGGDWRHEGSGGGAFMEGNSWLTRCRVVANSAGSGGCGGGIIGEASHVQNCLIAGNEAEWGSGILADGMEIDSCTVSDNSGFGGPGIVATNSTIRNCIVFSNGVSTNWMEIKADSTIVESTCSPGLTGENNVTNDPQFVDAAAGNYRLQATSPCLDAGDAGVVTWAEDLDGNPRIAFGAVDMGAYEAQLPGAGTWFGAITNGLTNDLDCAAGDGMPNLLKYAMGGSPRVADDNVFVGWARDGIWPILTFHRNPSATDVRFVVESADAMASGAVWRGVATNVGGSWLGATNVEESGTGNPVECTVTDPVALDSNRFLRLRVSRP